jgi:hypothetical protein
MSPVVGIDLVKNPDRALEIKNAIPIMFKGMTRGIFTGKKFADYYNPATEELEKARRIINGNDKAPPDRNPHQEILCRD